MLWESKAERNVGCFTRIFLVFPECWQRMKEVSEGSLLVSCRGDWSIEYEEEEG